jgi:mono/diheme cytochrome c family protein
VVVFPQGGDLLFGNRSKKFSHPSRIVLLRLFMLLLVLTPPLAGHGGEKEFHDDGPAFYARRCARCHRSLDKTFLNDRSAKRIRSAIDHVAAMRDLRDLSDSDLEAIAAALASPSGNAPAKCR